LQYLTESFHEDASDFLSAFPGGADTTVLEPQILQSSKENKAQKRNKETKARNQKHMFTPLQYLTESVREDGSVFLYAFLAGVDTLVNSMDLLFRHVKVTGYWVTREFHNMSREERQKEAATVGYLCSWPG
jgi:hypothetical protein